MEKSDVVPMINLDTFLEIYIYFIRRYHEIMHTEISYSGKFLDKYVYITENSANYKMCGSIVPQENPLQFFINSSHLQCRFLSFIFETQTQNMAWYY